MTARNEQIVQCSQTEFTSWIEVTQLHIGSRVSSNRRRYAAEMATRKGTQ